MDISPMTTVSTPVNIQWHLSVLIVCLILLGIVTVFGTLLVICAVYHETSLHTSTYYYVTSLAFADLLVGLIVIPSGIIVEMTGGYWPLNRFLCDIKLCIDVFASTASILGLCAIALDRYYAIINPMAYPNSFVTKKWYYVVICLWTCAAILSFPTIVYWRTTLANATQGTGQINQTIEIRTKFYHCEYPNDPYYVLFSSIVVFYFPLIIMLFVYVRIFYVARRQLRSFRVGILKPERQNPRSIIPKFQLNHMVFITPQRSLTKKPPPLVEAPTSAVVDSSLRIHVGKYQGLIPTDTISVSFNFNSHNHLRFLHSLSTKIFNYAADRKVAKMLSLIVGAFILCWLPFFSYFVLSGFFFLHLKTQYPQRHDLLIRIFSWFGYTNSALDFFVYALSSKEFRTAFIKLLCRKKGNS
ncbi:unnamed protein product [Didymodactylos carnosus]|uniref:G-protein coupled receptors family 1 profile domain-containing protein n=1 Tax=Didymodactylos carnosus TaxID=1234261 RepID=A0A8S2CL67_9BILA|nr:unnamed protein product [Didymodactylos carnosus]CAF3509050.1 unnamed protein product [Didymodactylos carnosus]